MKKRFIPVAVLCAAISVVALVAQSAEKNPLVGVWEVKVSAGGVPPPPLRSIAIFGGTAVLSRPVTPKSRSRILRMNAVPDMADGPKRATKSSN